MPVTDVQIQPTRHAQKQAEYAALALLYMRSVDASSMSPADFRAKYDQVLAEISNSNVYQADPSRK